jgi:CBS domain-containing protein
MLDAVQWPEGIMKISEVMSRNVAVTSPDATLKMAAELMRDRNIGFMPVMRNGSVVGVVTDRDIVVRSICDGLDPEITKVRDVMTRSSFQCYEDQVLTDAARIFSFNRVRRLLVFNRDKKLVGLLSLDDLAAKMSSDRLLGTVVRKVVAA